MGTVISNFQEYINALGAAELRALEIFSTLGVELIFFTIRFFLWCKTEKSKIAKTKQYKWKLLSYVAIEYVVACVVSIIATAITVNSGGANPFLFFLVNPMIGLIAAIVLSVTILMKYFDSIGPKISSGGDGGQKSSQPSVVVNINNGDSQQQVATQQSETSKGFIEDFLESGKDYISKDVIDEDIEKDVQMRKVVNSLVDVVYELSEVSVEYRKEFGHVNTSLESIEKTLLTINQSLLDMRDRDEEEKVINCRIRILRFNDEILINLKHSKEMFDQTLKDIDIYERYCEAHPDFENNITVMAVENIKDKYKSCMRNNSFL